jgi:NACalpha-BTF3-like transcription factor
MTDETPSQTAKSAEDRKAASALENLDSADSPSSTPQNVDADAANKAIKSLGASKTSAAAASNKNVKVDAADVALLVDELELPKPKATELLKSNEGDAVKAMRAFVKA